MQGNPFPFDTHRVERAVARVSHRHVVDDDAVVQLEGRERGDGRAGRGAEANVSHVVGGDGVRRGLRPAADAAAAADSAHAATLVLVERQRRRDATPQVRGGVKWSVQRNYPQL